MENDFKPPASAEGVHCVSIAGGKSPPEYNRRIE